MHLLWEWWSQLWPNMFAVSVWTTILFGWHHTSLKKHITSELERHHAHVSELLSAVSNSSSVVDNSSALFARSEIERNSGDIG